MTARLAIGVGCRMGCSAEAIADLVRRTVLDCALTLEAAGPRLFTLIDKGEEPGLRGAAASLGLQLAPLSRDALLAAMSGVVTPSELAARRFGVGSVSEAAALAGAGSGAKLLRPRSAANGATCAIASGAAA